MQCVKLVEKLLTLVEFDYYYYEFGRILKLCFSNIVSDTLSGGGLSFDVY